MNKYLLTGVLCIIAQFCIGQTTGDYQRITNKGTLPSEVYTPSTEKYYDEIQLIEADISKQEIKTKQQYYLESGFSIDEMMRSGTVLYNPEYNSYLESIADELLKGDPELRSRVHFYLLRSPVVNAFAGAGGNIFISMGLIAMLDNEAQLAYVMGHEIGHIAREHGLDFYMEATEIDKKSSKNSLLKKSSFDNTMITKNRYSQTLETEADDYGIQTLIRTKYYADTTTLDAVFDVLKYSYLPYENVSFPIEFFEGPHYVISKNLKMDSVKRISGTPETVTAKEANKSTHPSIAERREGVREFMRNVNTDNREPYLISENKFLALRNIARYELPMFYLHNNYFQDAIYSSYLILQKEPGNKYLEKIIAKSLTGLTKFRNSKDDEVYAEKARFETYEGEQQQLYFLLWAMNDVELNVMSLNYTFNLHLKYPEDKEILPICESLVNDLVFYHFNDEHDFYEDKTVSIDSLYTLSNIANPKIKVVISEKSTKKSRKLATVRAKRASTEKIRADKYKKPLLYAYYDYWENKEFRKLWNDAVAARDEREANAKAYKKAGIKYVNKGDTRDYFYASKLGIDKVVVVNPFYRRIDLRKNGGIEYVSGEQGEINYMDILKDNAALLEMDLEIIDPLTLENTDAEKFTDMTELNDWFSEQLDFGNINMPGYNQAMIDSIADKYNTDYFLWTGIISMRDRQNILGPLVYIALSPFFPPLLPYGIYELASPEYEFFYLSLLYNVKTREANVLKFLFLDNNDTRAILNSHTYEMLYEISTEPKNSNNTVTTATSN